MLVMIVAAFMLTEMVRSKDYPIEQLIPELEVLFNMSLSALRIVVSGVETTFPEVKSHYLATDNSTL